MNKKQNRIRVRRTMFGIAGALAIFSSLPSAATEEIYIPAVANIRGTDGAFWKTDLTIKPVGLEAPLVRIELLKRGEDNSADPQYINLELVRETSWTLYDIVGRWFHFYGAGALRLTTLGGDILVSSHTYLDSDQVGQYVPGIRAADAFRYGDVATLMPPSGPSWTDDSRRTNLGMVNLSPFPIELLIRNFDPVGQQISTSTVSLKPFEPAQIKNAFQEKVSYAEVIATKPLSRFLTYASVVQAASGDPIFIPGQRDQPTPHLPPVLLETDIVIYNPDVNVADLPQRGLTASFEFHGDAPGIDAEEVIFYGVLVTPERNDGGTTASPSRHFGGFLPIRIQPGGTVVVDDLRIYPLYALETEPLTSLDPAYGGVDPETGNDFIRQRFVVEFIGLTASGRRAATEPISLQFNFYWDE